MPGSLEAGAKGCHDFGAAVLEEENVRVDAHGRLLVIRFASFLGGYEAWKGSPGFLLPGRLVTGGRRGSRIGPLDSERAARLAGSRGGLHPVLYNSTGDRIHMPGYPGSIR